MKRRKREVRVYQQVAVAVAVDCGFRSHFQNSSFSWNSFWVSIRYSGDKVMNDATKGCP